VRPTRRPYLAALVLVIATGGTAIAVAEMQSRSQQATEASESARSRTPSGAVCWTGHPSPVTAMSAFKWALGQPGATNINVVCVAANMGQMCTATALLHGTYLSASAVPFIEDPPTKPRPGIAEVHIFATVVAMKLTIPLPAGHADPSRSLGVRRAPSAALTDASANVART
jgi:hypothetical protein